MTERAIGVSPQRYARIAGAVYLMTIITGGMAVALTSGRVIANLIATVCYLVVTVLFYWIFRPVSPTLSTLAALFSLVGCILGGLNSFEASPVEISPLVFFGVYCLLIGYLVLKSTFLPRVLGGLMALGGLGWLTFASPSLASRLAPFNMLPGVFGEGVLTLWLLVKGLDARKWKEQAGVAEEA